MALLLSFKAAIGGSLLPATAVGALARLTEPVTALGQQSASFATKAAAAKASGSPKKAAGAKSSPKKAAAKASAKGTKAAAASAATPKKRASAKKTDDLPRALNPYVCFVKATAHQWFTKGVNGAASGGLKRAAAAWKAMGDAERAKYVAQAAQTKAVSAAARAKAKAERAPPTAYPAFVKELAPGFLRAHPGAGVADLARAAAAQWKALPEAEKARRKLAADRARAQWAAARPLAA